MTEPQEIIRDDLIKELKEQVSRTMNRIKVELSKATERTLFGRKYNSKKIKRRLYYDVYYWTKTDRVSKYFESAKKAKNYVNYIHNSNLMEDGGYVRMEKTFCYREHSPRHKWFYISEKPDTFICAEKY
jgi:hypothetical protein